MPSLMESSCICMHPMHEMEQTLGNDPHNAILWVMVANNAIIWVMVKNQNQDQLSTHPMRN